MIFSVFFVLKATLKYSLKFINEYGVFETVETGDRAEESLGAAGEAPGTEE